MPIGQTRQAGLDLFPDSAPPGRQMHRQPLPGGLQPAADKNALQRRDLMDGVVSVDEDDQLAGH